MSRYTLLEPFALLSLVLTERQFVNMKKEFRFSYGRLELHFS
jgi:hypothetical protein